MLAMFELELRRIDGLFNSWLHYCGRISRVVSGCTYNLDYPFVLHSRNVSLPLP